MRPVIVVGLGGAGGWHALAWASAEVVATGGRLVLCHSCRPDSALAGYGPVPSIGLLELFEPALARAVATTRARLGGDRVTLRVRPGRSGPLLVDAAEVADLVVIGAPACGTPGGPGCTAPRVAAQAPCPVVVARPVAAHREAPFAGHVVVGVDDSAGGRAALEFGFGYADLHRRPLAAVHVSAGRRADHRFGESTPSPHLAADPADVALLAGEVEPWMCKYPDVATTRAVYAGRPASALLRAAAGASLLVVGNHGRGLGTVTDAVIDRAGCPVVVAPRL